MPLNETETFAVIRPLHLQCSLSLRVHFCYSFGIKYYWYITQYTRPQELWFRPGYKCCF